MHRDNLYEISSHLDCCAAHPISNKFPHNSYSINQNRRRTHHEKKQQKSEDPEADIDRPIFPSGSELREAARFEQASNRVNKRTTIRDHFGLAKELVAARRAEKSIDAEIRKVLQGGGVGSLPNVKGDNIGRFLFENWDSIAPWKNHDKIDRINALCWQFEVDCLLGNEVQVQWDLALAADRSISLNRLLLPGTKKRVVTGHNRHERFQRSQYGGTYIATFDRLSQFVQSTGSDPHCLGRYSWVQVGTGTVSTRIVSLYIPTTTKVSMNDDKQRRMTVYNQHRRYFRSIGDFRCPRAILVDHIGTLIALWIAAGEQVLLFTDANSNVYRGNLATCLASDDIRMTGQCREILGSESPVSHSTSSNPITGIFATSGIDCKHVLQSAHKASVGDHRFSSSMLTCPP
jgi:hypothetical protein